jgi:hypothetical protein
VGRVFGGTDGEWWVSKARPTLHALVHGFPVPSRERSAIVESRDELRKDRFEIEQLEERVAPTPTVTVVVSQAPSQATSGSSHSGVVTVSS